MRHWQVELVARDPLDFVICHVLSTLIDPIGESFAKPERKEAEETIDIEVVSILVRIPPLEREDPLGNPWVFRVLDLPEPHQKVSLGAHEDHALADEADELAKVLDVEAQAQPMLEVFLNAQLACRIQRLLQGL